MISLRKLKSLLRKIPEKETIELSLLGYRVEINFDKEDNESYFAVYPFGNCVIQIGLAKYNCRKKEDYSRLILTVLHELGHFFDFLDNKEVYLKTVQNLRQIWIKEVNAWKNALRLLKILRFSIKETEIRSFILECLFSYLLALKLKDSECSNQIKEIMSLIEKSDKNIESFSEKLLETEPIVKMTNNSFQKIKVFGIKPIKKEKEKGEFSVLNLEEILKEKRLKEFSFYKHNNILKVKKTKKRQKKGLIVKRSKTQIDFEISDNICANVYENKVYLGSKRNNEPFPEDVLINELENIIEHEVIHIVLRNLENLSVSAFFDVIEYQTKAVWNKEIPYEFLVKNKTDKDYNELKMAKFLTFYPYLSSYERYLAYNKLLEINLYSEKLKDKSLFHKELYEKSLELINKEKENNPYLKKVN